MFTEHKAGLSSGPLHYRKGGSGPPILHLHPAAGPRITPVIERLAARHTIYVPAAPGFDGTPQHAAVTTMAGLAGLMAEFVRTIIGDKCDVVAESFGGWAALWLAVKHPALVEHLVLEGPAGLRNEGTGGFPPDAEGRMRALYAHPERAPRETRPAQLIADAQRMRDLYFNGVSYDAALHAALGSITARTLIVFGTKDTVVPVITAHRLKAGIANSHLSFIYGAAHSLEFDAPEQAGRLIGAFLERGEAFVVPGKGAA